jgi:hypothetical protein
MGSIWHPDERNRSTHLQPVSNFVSTFVRSDLQSIYQRGDFVEIMEMLDKRLNDKGKNWRHVFKVAPPAAGRSIH